MMVAQEMPSACGNGKVRYRMHGQPGSSFVWNIQGGTQINIYASGDSVDVMWNNLNGEHSLSCQEFPATGCAGSPIIQNVKVDVLSVEIGDIEYLCEGAKMELNAGKGFTSYLWQDGSGDRILNAFNPGIYWVEVRKGKCVARDSMEIVRAESPVVYLGKDTIIVSPNRLLLDAQNMGKFYEWSTGSHSQTIWANEDDGEIWVRVISEKDCMASDTIRIIPENTNEFIIPNVFTPNGDGVNDTWRIGGLLLHPNTNVKLFDRWGRLIFNSEPGYPKPWNGERDGKLLPMDAYYYVIDLKDGIEPLRGSVTLIP